MKFGNSVKSYASYAKKHYIMTFVMILVVILIIIYFNKNRVFENYVSQYADVKNRNVTITFMAKNNFERIYGNVCLVRALGQGVSNNKLYELTNTYQEITGKSGNYGWAITIMGVGNADGKTFNFNTQLLFSREIDFNNCKYSAGDGSIIMNKSNHPYVNINYQSLLNNSNIVNIKASNVPYAEMVICLKFV